MSEATTLMHEVPEGWYSDPESPRMQRWWTGADWSNHVRHSGASVRPQPALALEAPVDRSPASAPASASASASASAHQEFSAFSSNNHFDSQLATASQAYVFDSQPSAPLAPAILEPEASTYVPLRHYYFPAGARGKLVGLRPYTPSTSAIWFMAISPVIWFAAQLLSQNFVSVGDAAVRSMAISGAMVVLLLVAAMLDGLELRRRGMASPPIGWFFLGLIPYFIARSFVLRRERALQLAPGIAFLLLLTATAALWFTVL